MTLSRKLYALKENPTDDDYFKEVHTESEAQRLNQDGYAIYWCVNSFNGPRQIKNLRQINSWYVEFDEGTKESQWDKIITSPIIPSLVVESFSGYQVYWNAIDATPENYREIEERLIHHFQSDPIPKDLTRVLRAPNYFHQKNPDDPFLVKIIFESEFNYRERIMLHLFKPIPVDDLKLVDSISKSATPMQDQKFDSNLNEFLDSLDNEWALSKLSNHWSVNYEAYSFKPVSRGRKNILVNGKSTSCFIDEKKRIGANPGGPVIFNWLKYYGHNNKEVVQILKEVFDYGKN